MMRELVGQLAVKYEERRRRLTCRRVRAASLLAAGVVPLYAIADYFLYPERLAILVGVRFASVVLALAIFILSCWSPGRHVPHLLGHTLGIGLGLTNSGVPVWLLGFSVPYYVGFILVILGVALFLPWRPSQVMQLGVSLLALYVVAALLHGTITNWMAFACNTSFIIAAVGIAALGMRRGEELRQREFSGRVALDEAREAKSQLATVLAEKSTKLESLHREIEDLLYVASHDLRAPLINVQGFSRELQLGLEQVRSRNGKSPETNAALADIDESLVFILTAVARMDALITSLLNVSRITTRTNPMEQVNLDDLAHKLAALFHHQLAERGVTLEIDPLPVVRGDSTRLGQLFGNLIDNAIKYMGSSAERRVHVGTRSVEGDERFFVRDTGPGIPREEQDRVFRLFRRLANGDCPGEGVGLTMVRKIVEKHGGKIWVESTPGMGATFWFTLRGALSPLDRGGVQ
jgi:signal transduction histidine kinase